MARVGCMANPKSASAFVREQPLSMSAADVVAKGEASGIKLSLALVYKVRGRMAQRHGAPEVKRGPGRPRKVANGGIGNGIERAIEEIVERKVTDILTKRLGLLLG